MRIIELSIDDIKPYEKNPRKNEKSVEKVAKSIEEFGFKVPIVIDKDNVIVCGHTRYKALQKLGATSVPCVIADDLTEEQIKAYRLADNKVGEDSLWDVSLLEEELEEILEIDMKDFGFEIPEEEEEEKHNERERTDNAYNLEEFDEYATEGFYQMPVINPVQYIPTDLIGFNYVLTSKQHDAGVHFYIDDYQFERVWNQPQLYLEKLEEFDCIFTPDFSLYKEMPIAMKIWNVYRSRLIGQMAQRLGMIVIPTVSWCEEDTFTFCFDGLPKKATLSISTIGVKKEEENFDLWKNGVDEMIRRLEPKTLLIYGGRVDYDFGNIKTIYYDNKVTERMKAWAEEVQDEEKRVR